MITDANNLVSADEENPIVLLVDGSFAMSSQKNGSAANVDDGCFAFS
jgi:hypothetical protein